MHGLLLVVLVSLFADNASGHKMGLLIPKNWQKDSYFNNPKTGSPPPAHFDWREEIPKEAWPDIANQGNCGSCWAFGTTAVLNWAYAIKNHKKIDLAEQEILSCSRSGSCRGGFFAHQYQLNGQSLEEEFPYTARDLRCKSNLKRETKIVRWGYVGDQKRNPAIEEIKSAIYTYGPVGVTVSANGAMQGYKGGKFKGCTKVSTNHIVHLVGWDDKEGVWYLGNSWGAKWGENGYMRIPFNCSRVGEITSFVEIK
jgi:C1A family cysteine protease